MILQCSECQYRYLVPDQAIGKAGRTVRCAHCRHTWFQALPAEAIAKMEAEQESQKIGALDKMLDAINTRNEATQEKIKPLAPGANVPALRRRFKIRIPAGLGVKLGAFAAGAAAIALLLLLIRPGLLGFTPSAGLVLADPGMVKLKENNRVIYKINGKILNTTDVIRRAPAVRIALLDEQGELMDKPRTIRFNNQIVPPGKAVDFTSGNITLPEGRKASRFAVDIGNRLELMLRQVSQ